jgi:DNA invertase Pin-like site-specific DNA recombinase
MNVIIYLRKSREDVDKEKHTGEDVLAVHRGRLVSLCEQGRHTYAIREEVVSGDTIAGRPEFQKVLYEDMPSGKYQGIAVNEISRLGRGNMKDAGEIYQTIVEHDIKIITPHKIYNPKNRSDLRQLRFELFLSREEFEMIRDRLKDGKDASARKGFAGNNIWVLGLDTHRGKYTVNPYEMETVNILLRMIADGHGHKETADYLNAMGRRTKRGKLWNYVALKWVIRNDHYLGYQTWQGETIKASHGVLVDPELIHRARARLESRDTWTSRANYFYWAKLHCDHCGTRMYGCNQSKTESNGKRYSSYVYLCNGRKTIGCRNQVSIHKAHQAIYDELCKLTEDKALQEKLIAECMPQIIDVSGEISLIKKEIEAKKTRMEQIKYDYISGEADISTYREAKKILTAQIKELQVHLNALEIKKNIRINDPGRIIADLRESLSKWHVVDDKVKYDICRSYIESARWNKPEKRLYLLLRLPL